MNSTEDVSSEDSSPSKVHHIARLIFILIGSLEVVSGVAGNCLLLTVLFTGIRSLAMRSSHHYFIVNLALSDLVTLGYWLPFFVFDLILSKHPVENDAHCKANGFIIAVCLTTGVLSLAFISLNRYLHVCHNHLYRRVFTRARTIACCVCLWVFSSLLALPPLLNVGTYGYSGTAHICTYRWENDKYPKSLIVIFVVGSMCVVGYLNYGIFRYWKMARLKLNTMYPLSRTNQGKRDDVLEIATDERRVQKDTLDSEIQSEQKAALTAHNDQSETSTEFDSDQSQTSTGVDKDQSQTSTRVCIDQSETTNSESREEVYESDAPDKEVSMSDSLGLAQNAKAIGPMSAAVGPMAFCALGEQQPQPLDVQPVRPLGNCHAVIDLHEQNMQQHHAHSVDKSVVAKANERYDDPQVPVRPRTSQLQLTPARGPQRTGYKQLSRRRRKSVSQEVTFVRSLCVVFFLMLFCFFPVGIAAAVDSFGAFLSPNSAIACNLVFFFSSSVNWIVYGVMNPSFRRAYATHVRRVVRMCWPRLFARLYEKRVNSHKGTMGSRSKR